MNAPDDSRPIFLHPPIVETVIGVQFASLRGFRAGHFGWFWREHLAEFGWDVVDDEAPIPHYSEKFNDLRLRLTKPGATTGAPAIRMKVRDVDRTKSVQLQPDKLYFTWNRESQASQSFTEAKGYLVRLFGGLCELVTAAKIGPIEPNLWDVTYINQIPSGGLWNEPRDWHKVLPRFFPPLMSGGDGVRFASYDGTWHYEIEPRIGRLHVNVAKMVRVSGTAPVLYLKLSARGEIGSPGATDWVSGLDLGREVCTKTFCAITSPEAHKEWGGQS